MADEDDVLIREVDEELQQEQTMAWFKKNGPVLIACAAAAIIGVGGAQIWRGMQSAAQAEAGLTYRAAVEETAGVDATADPLFQAADSIGSGAYAGLARLRAAGILLANDDAGGALEAYTLVANQGGLPTRLNDLARVRAAMIALDQDVSAAKSLASAVETETFLPFAREILAIAAMAEQDYATAVDTFEALIADVDAPQTVRDRASSLLPIALSGRAGVELTPAENDAASFIRDFSNNLLQEMSAEDDAAAETDALTDAAEGDSAP